MLVWDSFGNDWAKDLKEQLQISGLNVKMLSMDHSKSLQY